MQRILFITLGVLLTLTSCVKNENNSLTYKRYCYNRIVKAGSFDASYDMLECTYQLDFDNRVSSFTYNAIDFGMGEKCDIKIENIPFKQTASGYEFSDITDFVPVIVNGEKSDGWFVQGFSGSWELLGDYTMSTEFFQVQFTISIDGTMYNVQSNMVVYGFISCVTNITDKDGNISGSNAGTYSVTFNPQTSKSQIVINGARLSSVMSSGVDNWVISDIPAVPTYNGFEFDAKADSIFKPRQSNNVVPNVEIQVVSGNVYIPEKTFTARLIVNGEQVDVRAYMEKISKE
ncbi:MAG: hypothetical protein J1F10_01720 [Muribaculaceae bacterium]|nr:hypothetical protein [Muribaculaceae bacterium]